MSRVLSTAFCVVLLAATAAAFALTQGAKTERSPIYATKVAKVFSPVCDPKLCTRQDAAIEFRLRKRETLEVWIERDGDRKRVSTIAAKRSYPAGPVTLAFPGTGPDGITVLPDGLYRPVIRLVKEHRAIRLPNLIQLDTVPPKAVQFKKKVYAHLSPDGDGRVDLFRERYTLNGRGHGVLLVDGQQAGFTRRQNVHGELTWNGRVDGKLLSPGPHVLSIAAQDAAGNRSEPFPFAVVTMRYVKLGRTEIHAAPGRRFAVLVLTDAREVRWLIAGGRGSSVASSPTRTLKIRAPKRAGTYHLYVTAQGHTAVATVTVG